MSKNQIALFRGLFLLTFIALLGGCSGSESEENPSHGPGVDAPVVDLESIPADSCVFYDRKDVDRYISMADSECLKKALLDGVDGNSTHVDDFFGTKKILLELALEDSSLFFAKNNKYGAASVIALLLNYGGDANRKFQDGRTLLEKALRVPAESEPITLYVLHFAATNVNLPSSGGLPLEIAVDVKRENLVQALINRTANVNLFSKNSSLAHQALENDLTVATKSLINAGSDINAKNPQGASLVQRTISKEQRENFDLLVSKGAQLNTKTSSGETPLMTSVGATDGHFFSHLLNSGVDHNAVDSDGRGALYLAVSQNRVERAKTLLDKNAKVDGTTHSQGSGLLHVVSDVGLAQELVKKGARVDSLNNAKQSPLSVAVGSNRASLAGCFLSQGANLKWTDSRGQTLLHLAVANDSIETANVLFSAQISVTGEDDLGQEPIFNVRSVAMFDLLMSHGASAESTDKSGFHAFTKVYQHKMLSLDLLSRFVEKGAHPDADVVRGFMPLQFMLSMGGNISIEDKEVMLAFLMKAGANPNIPDRVGMGPIHYTRHLNIVKVLQAGGANLSMKDSSGRTLRQTIDKEATDLEKRLETIKKTGTEKEIEEAEKQLKPIIVSRRNLEAFLIEQGAE